VNAWIFSSTSLNRYVCKTTRTEYHSTKQDLASKVPEWKKTDKKLTYRSTTMWRNDAIERLRSQNWIGRERERERERLYLERSLFDTIQCTEWRDHFPLLSRADFPRLSFARFSISNAHDERNLTMKCVSISIFTMDVEKFLKISYTKRFGYFWTACA